MSEWWVKYQGHIRSVGVDFPEKNWIQVKSTRGFNLATFRYQASNPKAVICYFHGMHCASSDFTHIAAYFSKHSITTIAMDQEGHGHSGGEPGTIYSLDAYAQDCANFIQKAKTLYPSNMPFFLIGHSMGGALCVKASILIPEAVRGSILLAPALGVAPDFEPLLQKVVRCLNCCFSSIRLKALDQSLVSRNPHYPGYYAENPEFFSGKMNARTAVAMLNGFENLQLQYEAFKTPVIVFQGMQDKITSAAQAESFVKTCGSSDKEILLYPDMYHVLQEEPEIDEILARTLDWIKARI